MAFSQKIPRPTSRRMIKKRVTPIQSDRAVLRLDAGDHAGADGTTAFTNREARSGFVGDRGDQLDLHLDVVTGHDHLDVRREGDAPVTSVVRTGACSP